jgi:hypothetical protein
VNLQPLHEINYHSLKLLPSISFWIIVGSIGLFSLYFLFKSYQYIIKTRSIEDISPAKIRSAAQGYTCLKGTQHYLEEAALIAKLSQSPCTWYHYTTEHYERQGWKLVEYGTSKQPWVLDDGTGYCTIDPQNAQVETPIHDVWYGFNRYPNGKPGNIFLKMLYSFGHYRYQEWRMDEGMPLMAMGTFRDNTLSGQGATAREPFILSAIDSHKAVRAYKLAAFIWFVAYISILAVTVGLIISRYS